MHNKKRKANDFYFPALKPICDHVKESSKAATRSLSPQSLAKGRNYVIGTNVQSYLCIRQSLSQGRNWNQCAEQGQCCIHIIPRRRGGLHLSRFPP